MTIAANIIRSGIGSLPTALRGAILAVLLVGGGATRAQNPGPIHVGAFDLPLYSDLMRPETRAGLERMATLDAQGRQLCDRATKTSGPEIRACEKMAYASMLAEARKVYRVDISPTAIGGVPVDVITPIEGVSKRNANRVLIYIHGGGFKYEAGPVALMQGMPVAAIGKYRLVVVDYRMAPENKFPAASEDIAAVYKALLRKYGASQIGIYGCSAGGRIAGQAVAWFAAHGLPPPGALGILCSPPASIGGDSNIIVAGISGTPPLVRSFTEGYFAGVSPTDPLAFPGDADASLKRFPPTLVMTSTRDYSLSPMVTMHARLVRLGVPAELHIFEGLRHGQYMANPYIPETGEAAQIVSDFFDRHLARAKPTAKR